MMKQAMKDLFALPQENETEGGSATEKATVINAAQQQDRIKLLRKMLIEPEIETLNARLDQQMKIAAE